MPALTDNFMQVAVAGSETTMAAPGKSIGASNFNITSPTGWPTTTGLVVGVRRVDGSGNYVAGTYTEWVATLAGSVLTLNTTPLFGSDQTYAADGLTQVFIPLSASLWNKAMSTILNQHSQAGAHVGLTNSGGATFTGGITTDSLTVTGSNVGAGWTALGQTLTYLANNGQKEFTCTAPADLTAVLSVGMRLQITRNTAPPTQCYLFVAASSQYGTKASPAGITFVGNFTAEAWIYVNSYAAMAIISRDSAGATASGWSLELDSTGRMTVFWRNASGTSQVTSLQSVPLKRWVHVAAAATVATPTAAIYLNGVSIPVSVASSAATSVVQPSNNLSVGARPATVVTAFFDGQVSEARVWSVAQTQSAIQSNMAISLTGSESNLIAMFQGNGNFNDKTANANNLTATGGAIATQAANPYNTIEYALVTKVSYSNPTTTVTLFTGTDSTIPNMTLNSAQYSLAKVPFGWPAARSKWICDAIYKNSAQATGVATTWALITGAPQLMVPTGDFKLIYNLELRADVVTGGSFIAGAAGWSTATSGTPTLPKSIKSIQTDYTSLPTNPIAVNGTVYADEAVSPAALTQHYVLFKPDTNGTLQTSQNGFMTSEGNTNEVYAESAYA